MHYVALLGAGFTRNWGGWLANEVFEYLIGAPEVLADAGLRQLLWKHRMGGFEDALGELQQWIFDPAPTDPRDQARYWGTSNTLPLRDHLAKLQTSVRRMFSDMNERVTKTFDVNIGMAHSVDAFLARFDAIFTLNQDLLLERGYPRELESVSKGRWKGADLPGMRQGDWARATEQRGGRDFWLDHYWHPRPSAEFTVDATLQPIYKLHGSSNWFTGDGDPLLIIGGEKSRAISQFEVLDWYAREFEKWLAGSTRLMVIGYGFRDRHINDALVRAADLGVQLFVVDPHGSELGQVADSWNLPTDMDMSMDRLFERTLIGASRRNIDITLRENGAEAVKLWRFLRADQSKVDFNI